MEDGRYQMLLAKIYSRMEKIDAAIVSLQQVKGKPKNTMKSFSVLTFIPGFAFVPDSNHDISVNEGDAYVIGIKH